jgi:hypothetical protein
LPFSPFLNDDFCSPIFSRGKASETVEKRRENVCWLCDLLNMLILLSLAGIKRAAAGGALVRTLI